MTTLAGGASGTVVKLAEASTSRILRWIISSISSRLDLRRGSSVAVRERGVGLALDEGGSFCSSGRTVASPSTGFGSAISPSSESLTNMLLMEGFEDAAVTIGRRD